MSNNISLLKIINGLSKTINIANQMLPLYNQIKPIITSGSKMLSNINTSTKIETPKKITKKETLVEVNQKNNSSLPTFFQ